MRHRMTIHDLARDGRLSEEEAEVVNSLGTNLMEVWDIIEKNSWTAVRPSTGRKMEELELGNEESEMLLQVGDSSVAFFEARGCLNMHMANPLEPQ